MTDVETERTAEAELEELRRLVWAVLTEKDNYGYPDWHRAVGALADAVRPK